MTAPPSDPPLAWQDVLGSSLAGRRIGPYLLESELGRGGMGSVWLARRDDGQYQGAVAIKLLATAWLGEEGVARFRREGTLLASLDHPNIARLLDAGINERGEPYLVLEYVAGQRIDEYCAGTDLDVRARIELFLELLNAVAHAHRNLIVHRDIKPANVLVTPEGKPKLLDFGISKLVQDQEPAQTRTGHRILTPQYAAPEQLLGECVTTSTDIYGLGLLLYVLLAGRLPHSASASPADLFQRITTGSMPPPSSVAGTQPRIGAQLEAPLPSYASARRLHRELRGDLDNIVLKAVHASPEQRYQDIGAFATDLRRYLNHEPVTARAATWPYRFGKFLRRNRTAVAATLLVCLMLGTASVITISQMMEARRQRAAVEDKELTVSMISDFMRLTLFSEGGPAQPTLTMAERLQRGAQLVEKQYADNPSFAGRLLLSLASITSRRGDQSMVPLQMLDRAYALGRQANDVGLMASIQCTRVVWMVESDRDADAERYMQDAQRLMASMRDLPVMKRAGCMSSQAYLEQKRSRPEVALGLLLEAEQLLERGGYTGQPLYNHVMAFLTVTYSELNRAADALSASERAARLDVKFGRAGTSEHLVTRHNISQILLEMGEVAGAMAERERINLLLPKFFRPEETPVQHIVGNTIVLLRMQRTHEAQKAIEATLPRVRLAKNPAMLYYLLYTKSWAHLDLGELDEAAGALTEAGQLATRGAGNPAFHSSFELLRAQLAAARKDADSAWSHLAEALALSKYGASGSPRGSVRVLLGAARVALTLGRQADAQRYASDALRWSEQVARSADSSANVGEALLLVAQATPAVPVQEQRRRLERAERCLSNGLRPDHPLTVEARRLLSGLAPKQE